MRMLLMAGAILAMFSGCIAGEKIESLREGMSPDEVVAVMGRPDGQQRLGDFLGYSYADRLMSGWKWNRADYVVIFKDDKVTAWGPGQIRPGESPIARAETLVLVPFVVR